MQLTGKNYTHGLAVDHRIAPNTGHMSFLAPCTASMRMVIAVTGLVSATEAVCDDPDGFDRSAFHRRFNCTFVDFFGKTLPRHSS
jgi:predicted dienelactone hydrolase